MTPWSAWSINTCPCGYSTPRNRTRSVLLQLVGNGKPCPPTHETTNCPMVACNCAVIAPGYYGNRCENRHCSWAAWLTWSACKQCSDNCVYPCPVLTPTKTRKRKVDKTKVGEGNACTDGDTQTNSCGYRCVGKCEMIPNTDIAVCMYVRG